MANKKKEFLWRVYLAFMLIAVFGLAIISKTAYVQLAEGSKWIAKADSLTIFHKNIEPERGNIYASDGSLLATSLPYFEIRMDFKSEAMTDKIFNENIEDLAQVLADKIGEKSFQEYKNSMIKARNNGNRYYLIKRKVTYPELQEIKTWPLFELGRYKSGMITIKKHERKMPFGLLAQRSIGYIRDEGKVKVGLEGMFNKKLQGESGKILVQKIAGGTLIPLNGKGEINPQPGQDLHTTLDINIQDVAESALQRTLEKHKADHGCAIVMEVKTGKIKAIANLGKSSTGKYYEKYNYAIGEKAEPGSTFKLAGMLALLEDGYVNINDSIDLEDGKKKFFDRYMKDAYRPSINTVTVKRAFEKSSNVGISKLVNANYATKADKFYGHLENIGLTKPLGIEIKGEPEPTIKKPEDWSGISLPWISVGYELELTPLQMLAFYNAVANDGVMMKPYLVNEIREDHKRIDRFKPVVLNKKICSKQTIEVLQELLAGVVNDGTAKNIKSNNYSIAGKTGTCLIANQNTTYSDRQYRASFAGYFPADQPKYSCIVVVSAPKSGVYYGNLVAAPVFKEIADNIYASDLSLHQNKSIQKIEDQQLVKAGDVNDVVLITKSLNRKIDFDQTESGLVKTSIKDGKTLSEPIKNIENLIPNVKGMGARDAAYLLESKGLIVYINGKGKVKTQSIPSGRRIVKGSKIYLELS